MAPRNQTVQLGRLAAAQKLARTNSSTNSGQTPKSISKPIRMLHHGSVSRKRRHRAKFKLIAKLSVRKLPQTFRYKLQEMFVGGTTGLDQLIGTYGNRYRFTVWLVTYLFLVGCLIYFVNCVLSKYFQFKTAISTTTLEPDSLEFPAVTICNLNYLRKSSFCRDEKIYAKFRNRICSSEDQSRQSVFHLLSLSPRILKNSSAAESRDWVMEELKEHAIPWDSAIKYCRLARKTCLRSDLISIRPSSNPEYGMCYTLFEKSVRRNLTEEGTEQILTIETAAGPSEGLHLVLDVNEEEYLPFLPEKGFVVMIHNFADSADVSREGIWVPTNRRTYIGIEKDIVRLMEPPYDTSCQPENTWPAAVLNLNPNLAHHLRQKPYSTVMCDFICRALNVIEVCDCEKRHGNFDYALTCVERLSGPGHDTNFTCKDEFTRAPLDTARRYNRPLRCVCPPKCIDAVFEKQVSYSRLRSVKSKIFHSRNLRSQTDGGRQSSGKYAEVFVYFKDIREEVTSVSATYTYEKMMNEVGGFLGSFVGMAFISIFEILENFALGIMHLAYPDTLR